ncbi:MAG: hypothetical protein H7Y04_04555 [Verrucomicrobia bacterium]|nr:hypothetical protein [Cytophagales bacterium]
MIQYFKKLLPDRFILLFVSLLLLRLPSVIQGLPLLNAELGWQVLGERLADGWLLYKDVWDDVAPLSAAVYALLDLIFGRSVLAYQLLSALLVAIQAFQFQFIVKKPLFAENSLIPALLYVLVCHLFYDFYTLSPALMSISLLIPALNRVFRHIESPLPDENLFALGFFVGMATLFYSPCFLFFVAVCLGLLVVASISPRQIFLIIFGYGFTLGIAFIIFYLFDASDDFYYCFIKSITFRKSRFTEISTPLIIALPLIGFLGLSIFRAFVRNQRLVNYQLRSMQFMFFWSLAALVSTQLNRLVYPFQFVMLAIPVAFFGTHLFISIRKKWWAAELAFLVFTASVVGMNWVTRKNFFPNLTLLYTDYLKVNIPKMPPDLKNKKVLVLGENLSYYTENSLATPYLNPFLSARHLADMDNYTSVKIVYEHFQNDAPEIIIDPQGVIKPVFKRLFVLEKQYRPHPVLKNVYIKI